MNLIELLNFFGMTPSQLTPVVLSVATIGYFFYRKLDTRMVNIENYLIDIHYAVKEIQNYLRKSGFEPQHLLPPKPSYKK